MGCEVGGVGGGGVGRGGVAGGGGGAPSPKGDGWEEVDGEEGSGEGAGEHFGGRLGGSLLMLVLVWMFRSPESGRVSILGYIVDWSAQNGSCGVRIGDKVVIVMKAEERKRQCV